MTPEDWEKGIENEAASVEDAAWSAQTRRLASRQRYGRAAMTGFIILSVTEGYVLLMNELDIQQSWAWIRGQPWLNTQAAWLTFILFSDLVSAFIAGLVLSWARLGTRLTALVFCLCLCVFSVLTGLLMPEPARPFASSYLKGIDLYPRPSWEEVLH